MTDKFYGSLGRMPGRYNQIVAQHVSPAVITSTNRESIMPSGTRALTIGRGGRATKATSITPADLTMPASLAGDMAPGVFSKTQETGIKDVPASEANTNPIWRIQYKATPIKLGDLIKGLGSADRDQILPLPQPRDFAWMIDEGFAKLKNMNDAFKVDAHDLVRKFGGLHRSMPAPENGILMVRSTQQARLGSELAINTILANMEIKKWRDAQDGEDYEEHFYDEPALTTFLDHFTFAGAVVDHGMANASGVNFHRSGGNDSTKMVGITTAGQATVWDYANSIANVEQASCNFVIARQPMKTGTIFDMGWDPATSYGGSYQRHVDFVRRDDLGPEYNDTIYPIQVRTVFWPDGDRFPATYTNPVHGPHMFGADSIRVGNMFFRNIGNTGSQPSRKFSFSSNGTPSLYTRPPNRLASWPKENSTLKIAHRRPIQVILTGNAH